MMIRPFAALCGVLLCLWLSVLPAQSDTPRRDTLAARFDALAEEFMATQAVPGAIGALVLGDAVILRGWGYADLDAGTLAGPAEVRFEIGSTSKLFTWLAVMMLVEEGALDLHADVAGYLRETPVPGDEPLTLAQLMSHRPGFEESYALFDLTIGALPRPEALAASAPAQVFPRGLVTAYSNWGVALAGVRLIAPATMAQMRTRLFDDLAGASDMADGFQSRPLFGTMAYGHAGGLNEFVTNLVFIPDLNAGVFVSQNGGTGASLPMLLPDLMLAHLALEAGLSHDALQSVPDASARAAEVAGRYLTNRRPFHGPMQALSPQISVQALPDGTILAPSTRFMAMVQYAPLAPDLWQEAQGERIMAIRDASGRVVRLIDGMGVMSYERGRPATDPMLAAAAFGLSTLLALTTLMGLIWRRGLKGGSPVGTLIAGLGVTAAGTVWLLVIATGLAVASAMQLGMEFMFDHPQPTLVAVLLLADALAVLAALVLLSLVLVWRAPDWSLGRRLHHSALGVSLGATAVLFWHWGLAFGGMG